MIRRTTARWRLCIFLLAANLIFIWGNSLLSRSVSGALSGWLHSLLQPCFSGGSVLEQGHGLLRKLAHFTEFCCLGVLLSWLFAMKKQKKRAYILPALVCGCLAACVDEVLQCFVPGRGPSFWDVGIDSMGILIGVCLLTLGCIIREKTKKQ